MIKSGRMKWVGHVVGMGETRNVYRILVGKPERKRPLGISRHRWVDNIKTDLRDRIGWCGLARSGSGYGPLDDSCEHGDEPSISIKCWGILEWLHNSRLLKEG
jgi:hypothetical protein